MTEAQGIRLFRWLAGGILGLFGLGVLIMLAVAVYLHITTPADPKPVILAMVSCSMLAVGAFVAGGFKLLAKRDAKPISNGRFQLALYKSSRTTRNGWLWVLLPLCLAVVAGAQYLYFSPIKPAADVLVFFAVLSALLLFVLGVTLHFVHAARALNKVEVYCDQPAGVVGGDVSFAVFVWPGSSAAGDMVLQLLCVQSGQGKRINSPSGSSTLAKLEHMLGTLQQSGLVDNRSIEPGKPMEYEAFISIPADLPPSNENAYSRVDWAVRVLLKRPGAPPLLPSGSATFFYAVKKAGKQKR